LVAKHGPGFKPPSYHDIREKFLKQEMDQTMKLLEEYKLEWKKTSCLIISDGWIDKKRHCICNFFVNSPKRTIFFCHRWILLIYPRLLIRYLRC